MKLNNHLYRTAALLLVLLAAACTREDDFAAPPDNGTATPAPLTITVTDGAYAPAQSPDGGNTPATRAVERGYGTEFTAGDKIGLYVLYIDSLNRRKLLRENLCITYNGTEWTFDSGEEQLPPPPKHPFNKHVYFAYYPYQPGMDSGKISISATDSLGLKTEEARWFFQPLINDWTPADDQRTYKAYTASDLMVARGEVAERTDGTDGSALSFTMEHQMALAVIRVPTTKYLYTETIGGVKTEKSYRLYSGLTIKGWMANDNTYRYLVNHRMGIYTIEGSYYNVSLKKRNFKGTSALNSPGKYVLCTVDGGVETVTERSLQARDFYMSDGGVIPKEKISRMPTDVQADCIGVVFWVGENEGQHWTLTGLQKGDRLLVRDHPGCVHGMVVALYDAAPTGAVWAEGSGASEDLYKWAKSFSGFNAGEQADWSAIEASNVAMHGYGLSHLVKLYSVHHPDAAFPAYNMISNYADLHPAPGSSSGWFLSSQGELAMMCYGMADNYHIKFDKTPRDYLNERFKMAGGDALEGKYWSATDPNNYVWYLNFSDGSYNYHPKSNAYKVRAVLAF